MTKLEFLGHFHQIHASRKGNNRTNHIPLHYQVQKSTFPEVHTHQDISTEAIRNILLSTYFLLWKVNPHQICTSKMFLHLQKVDIPRTQVHSHQQEAVFLQTMSYHQGLVEDCGYEDIDVGYSVPMNLDGVKEMWSTIRMDNVEDIASTCLPPFLKSCPFERYYLQQFPNSHLLS